ncbi:MAG: ABC transporter ATP-binding protein/permease [Candidatus Jidaibacter sp.]|jgi:ATP-binding cassette subfamily B protein|nr:ABC transporter ATP-binding protein/permease [Candidatus Jidaibacter sp.]
MKRQKANFLVFFIACLATSLSSSIWPYITGQIIDALSGYAEDKSLIFNQLGHLFFSALAFWIFLEFLMRLQGFASAAIYPKFEANIRMAAFEYVNRHSHAYFSNNFVGSIANRISDLPRSSSIVIDFIFNNLIPLVIAIFISSMLFMNLDIALSMILLSWLIMHLSICYLTGARAAELSRIQSEARTYLQGRIVDTLNNHLNVKLYTKQYFEVENVRGAQDDERAKNRATLLFIEKSKVLLSLLALVSITLLFWITIRFWQDDHISLGEMIFVFTSTLNILTLAFSATVEMAYLFREIGVIKQALKVIKDPIDVMEHENAKALKVTEGKIEFVGVTFKYKHNNNVFKEKTLTIEGGQKVGLVGLSGSGKTTFAHLILRLFNIESGSIQIDGQDINQVTLKSLRDNICLIPQEPMLFHRSIMDNIRYSSEGATDEEVVDAAKKANCHEFIMELEDGYNSAVGERAAKISGGQKQRIAIARAILKDAPILIMDEATSALDSYTEKQIQDSVRVLSEDKTTIIIAHRLSTLLEMDRILVFDKGAIIEDGSHKELIEKNGHYAMLWKMQTAGLLPDALQVV